MDGDILEISVGIAWIEAAGIDRYGSAEGVAIVRQANRTARASDEGRISADDQTMGGIDWILSDIANRRYVQVISLQPLVQGQCRGVEGHVAGAGIQGGFVQGDRTSVD